MNITGATFIDERVLENLELPSYENGYYWLDEDSTIDVEGDVRYEDGKKVWICKILTKEELELFIQWVNR